MKKVARSRSEISAEQLRASCPTTPVRWQPLPQTATVESELDRLEAEMEVSFTLEEVNKRADRLVKIPINIANARAAIAQWEAEYKTAIDLRDYDAYVRGLHGQAKVTRKLDKTLAQRSERINQRSDSAYGATVAALAEAPPPPSRPLVPQEPEELNADSR